MSIYFRALVKNIKCYFTLLMIGAFSELFRELGHQIFGRESLVCLARDIEGYGQGPVECKIKYHFRQASREDMKEVFHHIKTESKEGALMLLERKWLYECGFGDWFVVRSDGIDEPCYFQCVMRPGDNVLVEKGFQGWFSRLEADEIILESAYTFEKYRGNRIAPSFVAHLMEIYGKEGFKRVRVYINKNREERMKKAEEAGFKRCEEINIMKILSFTIMKSGPYQPSLA